MDKRTITIQALKGSIAKWDSIAVGQALDHGTDNCSLCQRFHTFGEDRINEDEGCCVGCPVHARTGHDCCEQTPFADFTTWTENRWPEPGRDIRLDPNNPDHSEGIRLALAERDFLQSLLDELEQ